MEGGIDERTNGKHAGRVVHAEGQRETERVAELSGFADCGFDEGEREQVKSSRRTSEKSARATALSILTQIENEMLSDKNTLCVVVSASPAVEVVCVCTVADLRKLSEHAVVKRSNRPKERA